MATRTVDAARFKRDCVALLGEVSTGAVEVVVTKRGKPVARLVPIESAEKREAAILAKLRANATSVVAREEDLLLPTSRLIG